MKKNILIVEDEVIIANLTKVHLENQGYKCIGIAVDFDETIEILKNNRVDLVLLDINISGEKSGIDLGKLLYLKYKIPFIYISSYSDKQTIEMVKDTFPDAYFIKPIVYENLLLKIELILYKIDADMLSKFQIKSGKDVFIVNLNELICIQAEHVYVELMLENEKLLLRTSLKSMLEMLPEGFLLQVNRSVAVNPKYITKVTSTAVYTTNKDFSITQTYKENFIEF